MSTATQPQVNVQDLQSQIALLQAQIKAQRELQGGLTLRVSEKGALSVYGMGRFPVTLYREQWERLAKAMPLIQEFITANADKLKVKGQE